MATAMVMQLRRNAGFMFRETVQAMERLGMSMMGDYSYMEPREFCACRRSHFAPAARSLSLPSRVPPRAHGPQSPTRALGGCMGGVSRDHCGGKRVGSALSICAGRAGIASSVGPNGGDPPNLHVGADP